MVNFANIVKIATIFEKCFLTREISDLRTCNPGAKKLLNFLKKCFICSESIFELLMAHGDMCKICK